MNWNTIPYTKTFVPPSKPYAVADVRYANGADNIFVEQLFKNNFPEYGYSAWNTSANTIGSLIAAIKVKYMAKKYNDNAFKKLQLIRYLDDWAYQANIRKQISKPCNIKELMEPFEERLFEKLGLKKENIKYIYPWNRKFEIEICVTKKANSRTTK